MATAPLALPAQSLPRRLASTLHHASSGAAAAAGLIGLVVLAGRAFDWATLMSAAPTLAATPVNLAVGLVLLSVGLWCSDHLGGELAARAAPWLGGLVALLGAATLVESAVGIDLHIEPLALAGSNFVAMGAERMLPLCALQLVLLGIALTSLDVAWRGWRPSEGLALTALALALPALSGYGAPAGLAISPIAACAFAALGIGVLAARPREGWVAPLASDRLGGIVARRVLIAALGLPLAAAWVNKAVQRTGAIEGDSVLAATLITVFASIFAISWTLARDVNRLEAQWRESASWLQRLADTNIIGVVVSDLAGRVHECNEAFLSLLGYSRKDLTGARLGWDALTPPQWHELDRETDLVLRREGRTGPVEKELQRRDGTRVPVVQAAARLAGDPEDKCVGFVLDMSERKRLEQRLVHSEARMAAAQELAQVGSWSWEVEPDKVEWSKELARIYGWEPKSGRGCIADLLAPVHPDDRERLRRLLDNGRRDGRRFSCDYRIQWPGGRMCTLHARARGEYAPDGGVVRLEGVAQDVTEHREEEELFRYRDVLEQKFAGAMNSLWLAYQPIIEWSSRRVFAYEALVRSDEAVMRYPSVILRAAEKLGRMRELGERVRDKAAGALPPAPPSPSPILFVNVHVHDLLDESLYAPSALLSAAAKTVVLEITERAGLEELKDVRSRVASLREMGFRLAIDDLGAGYSGLLTFAQLEPDFVKLDMSLVRDVHQNATQRRLIQGIVALCRRMGIRVVAEGVETIQERNALLDLGCDLLQGYLFARPDRSFPSVAWEQAPVARA